MVTHDWKRIAIDENHGAIICGKKHDMTEAINHILVSRNFPEIAKHGLTEEVVLDLHSRIMRDLLHEGS